MLVEIELVLLGRACTDKALGFEHPDDEVDEPVWFPKSKIENLDDIFDRQLDDQIGTATEEVVVVHIPMWLAENSGLESYGEEVSE